MAKRTKAGGRKKRELERVTYFIGSEDRKVLQGLADEMQLTESDIARIAIHEYVESKSKKGLK